MELSYDVLWLLGEDLRPHGKTPPRPRMALPGSKRLYPPGRLQRTPAVRLSVAFGGCSRCGNNTSLFWRYAHGRAARAGRGGSPLPIQKPALCRFVISLSERPLDAFCALHSQQKAYAASRSSCAALPDRASCSSP